MRYVALIIFIIGRLWAQNINYVNNPSFELSFGTSTVGGWNAAPFWPTIADSSNCAGLYLCTKANGDVPYFFGYQWPRSGERFAISQFYSDASTSSSLARLYPRNLLKKPLKPNTVYCAKYFIVNTNNCVVGIDAYGVYCGDDNIDTITTCLKPLTYLTPQVQFTSGIVTDTLNWTAVTGTFVAMGGEKYMMLGNFKSNAATNTLIINPTFLPSRVTDVIIDDVSLIEYNLSAFAGRDTSIFPGDSVFIGRAPEFGLDELCTWYKPPSTVPIDTIAGFWANPIMNTKYVVRQEICGQVKWDTVTIYTDMVGMLQPEALWKQFKIWPMPCSESFRIVPGQPGSLSSFNSYKLYSTTGIIMTDGNLYASGAEVDVRGLPDGVYILEISGLYRINRRVIVSKR